jgi:hypothetical protein
MSKSPVSAAFHQAFAAEFMPLLQRIGLEPAKPSHVKPGLLVAQASRALKNGKCLEVCLWCDGGTGHNLRFRVDVETTGQVDLNVPWPDPAFPNPRTLDFSGQEFLPGQDTEQLTKAIAFLAGAFAACADQLANAVPELRDHLETASREEPWLAAKHRAGQLWRTRHSRGDVDHRAAPARVIFVGANLVMLDADGVRLTFRFDTRAFDRGAAISVSGWFLTPAGTRRATQLNAGDKSWTFDVAGALA